MSGMVNTIVKNYFEVDLNFHPIRVIRFRNSDPDTNSDYDYDYNKGQTYTDVKISFSTHSV